MFPFDRFGLVHLIRIVIEFILLICSYSFGSCRYGMIFGFNSITSILFSIILLLATSIDIYYFFLSIFSSETPKRTTVFHIVFYSLMSLLTLTSSVFSIIGLIFCLQNRSNYLCETQSCFIYLIGIILMFILTTLFSISAKLLCCLRNLD